MIRNKSMAAGCAGPPSIVATIPVQGQGDHFCARFGGRIENSALEDQQWCGLDDGEDACGSNWQTRNVLVSLSVDAFSITGWACSILAGSLKETDVNDDRVQSLPSLAPIHRRSRPGTVNLTQFGLPRFRKKKTKDRWLVGVVTRLVMPFGRCREQLLGMRVYAHVLAGFSRTSTLR